MLPAVLDTYNGRLWAKYDETYLVKSDDHGISWETFYIFKNPIITAYADTRGNMFVVTCKDRWEEKEPAELFKAAYGSDTFRKVLDIESGSPYHWNITSADGVMFVSEYGYKKIDNYIIRLFKPLDNARRIYRSLDYGDTWEVVYKPKAVHNWHNHRIIIHNGTIYQSIGDMPHNHIIKSTDNGETWQRAIDNMHPTSAAVFDNIILWGLDSGAIQGQLDSGIIRYNTLTEEIESVWSAPLPYSGSCYDMNIANGIVYAMFLSYGGDEHPASIWYSRDEGISWEMLGRIDKLDWQGVGLWKLTADDFYGYIDIQTIIGTGGKALPFYGTLRFALVE